MPSQRTVTLSKEALIKLSVAAIENDCKVKELCDSIICNTNWEREAARLAQKARNMRQKPDE